MKLSEMREKTVEELKQFIVDSKKQLLDARIKKSMHKLENTAEISKTKRLVAQAKTVIKEKEIDYNTYIFKAQISLIDFCKIFSIDDDYFAEIEGESDTLAGLILEMEGRIPEIGFKCTYKQFSFEITEADNKHLIKIKVIYQNEE